MRKSTVFFVFCLAFVLGVAVHSFFSAEKRFGEPFWWYVVFLICGTLGTVFLLGLNPSQPPQNPRGGEKGKPSLKVIGMAGLCLAFLFLGLFRYAQSIPAGEGNNVLQYAGREVILRGVVDSRPQRREKTVTYVLKLQAIRGGENMEWREVGGKFLLTAPVFPAYNYGDALMLKCAPAALNAYERYFMREGVSASCAFPETIASLAAEKPERHFIARVQDKLWRVRESVDQRVRALFADPYAGLLAGILYGDTSGLSSELKRVFRITGLAHITALSGYNISVISVVLVSSLIYIGLTRKQALPVTTALIVAFVFATGAEASVVRAAIMGLLAMLAKNIGRLSNPRNALVFAGALMLAINPRLLFFDLGFLLSFLATIALIWFADDIKQRTIIRKLPELVGIREAGAASVVAFLFTTPLILYKTGLFSPLAMIVNILVVPIVPLAMALGFGAIIADFAWHPLGLGAAFLARVPLDYIIKLAEWFSRFGAMQRQISFITALVLFIGIVMSLYVWKKRTDAATT